MTSLKVDNVPVPPGWELTSHLSEAVQFGKLSHSYALTLSEAEGVSELARTCEAIYAKSFILELGNLKSREAENVTRSQPANWRERPGRKSGSQEVRFSGPR